MSHHRNLSPGSRRLLNPGRTSDNSLNSYDPHHARHGSYSSPRSSVGVVPISTQTYVNVPSAPTSAREWPGDRYDPYTGRTRRSSLSESQRNPPAISTSAVQTRSKPTVVQNSGRPRSPPKSTSEADYYVTPASSKEPRKVEHKKLYSVDEGSAKLVAHVNVIAGGGARYHRRRESGGPRLSYPNTGLDRGRRSYHMNGDKRVDKSLDDEGAYSYTDAAGMYRDTEPRRDRPRRGSMDRAGASRERPVLVIDPAMTYDPRASAKDIGPPPSTRGWDRLNDGIGRTRSVRDGASRVAQSPTRGRFPDAHAYGGEPYIPPRATSNERRTLAVHQDRPVEPPYDAYYDEERREPRYHDHRNSLSRAGDRNVERRGFGIRSDSRDRYGRTSDESFHERQRQQYRDSGYAEPQRRDTAPELSYHDEMRLEQEKKDRMRLQEERERAWEREKETRRREEERRYERDRERQSERERGYDVDQDRERDRERIERESDRDRERQHYRRETAEREYRKDVDSRNVERTGQPSLAQAATGGLAAAAAALGVGKMLSKDKDNEKDRDFDRERERDRDRDRGRDRERDRDAELRYEEPRKDDHDRDREREREHAQRLPGSHSDEVGTERSETLRGQRDADRGLGFAFENPPEIPKYTTSRDRERERDRTEERDLERQHEDRPVEMPRPAVDAEEDYRRRMEQVKRELGRAPDQDRAGSDSDPDRERRRREREQRTRERSGGDDAAINAGVGLINETVPPPTLRGSFERDHESNKSSTQGSGTSVAGGSLRRRPSILDQPVPNGTAQIIDNSASEKRENRVRIVEPPATDEEDKKPRGILKKPTQKFPEHPDSVREGVAPLKDATKNGIPPGARWTKIDRRLVNPEALKAVQERYEERADYVIVLRVLTREEIQKLADRTREIRERHEEDLKQERRAEKAARRRDRARDRRERDEYSDDSENEYAERAPKMLEAPPSAGAVTDANFKEREEAREREREREFVK